MLTISISGKIYLSYKMRSVNIKSVIPGVKLFIHRKVSCIFIGFENS